MEYIEYEGQTGPVIITDRKKLRMPPKKRKMVLGGVKRKKYRAVVKWEGRYVSFGSFWTHQEAEDAKQDGLERIRAGGAVESTEKRGRPKQDGDVRIRIGDRVVGK